VASKDIPFDLHQERIKLWREYRLRTKIATLMLYVAFMLILFLFFYAVVGERIHLDWPSLSLIWVLILVLAFPLLSKVNISKDGGGVDFADSLGIIDRLEASEAKAAAARSESFEQTRLQISALSLEVSELAASLQRQTAAGHMPENPSSNEPAVLLPPEPQDQVPDEPKKSVVHEAVDPAEPNLRAIRRMLPAPTVENDPQKNRFGGSASNNNRVLTAKVERSDLGRKWFSISLEVASTDGQPLTGSYVFFFLHDSFEPDAYRVRVPSGASRVYFDTTAIGAFTVGAVADKGKTMLELDLASDAVSAPQSFKEI
jgi:hypothetical protein